MKITFRSLEDTDKDYLMLYHWCQNDFVYEWFEQRKLSFEEIRDKYREKLNSHKQDLLIIQYGSDDIGLVQLYPYPGDIKGIKFDKAKKIYEFDIFIGNESYLSKGIGSIIVNLISEVIYSKYNADAILLRPFKRNTRAINCYLKCNYNFIYEYDGSDTLGNLERVTVLLRKKVN